MEALHKKIENVQDDVNEKLVLLNELIDVKFKHVSKSFDAKFEQYLANLDGAKQKDEADR